ncbi:MAG: ABC transporter ATP-binding protein [Pseudomonadota bacterium]
MDNSSLPTDGEQQVLNKNSAKADQKPLVSMNNIKLTLGSEAGKVDILRGISLDIAAGERLSIVGPSGSGKTTLLMVLSGLQMPTSGSVSIADADITEMNEDELAGFRRDNIGIVFQNFHLVPTMTALENVATPLEFAGDREAFAKAEKVLEAVGLGHRLTHYPGQLSGGEQQRTALARALVGRPKLLLADEPTGNLDGETGEKIIEQLFHLSEESGTTLVLVTHDIGLAARCDRSIHIADGVLE